MSVSFYPDVERENKEIQKKVLASVADLYPIHGNDLTMHMTSLRVAKMPDPNDFTRMKRKRIRNQDYSATVKGDFVVKDKQGRTVLELPNQRVMRLPVMTKNLGFIVGGTEYQINTVPRLKSGAYPRVKRTGELEVSFNLLEGQNMSLGFDPRQKKFTLSFIGSARKVPLRPVLDALGTPEKYMEQAFGKEITEKGRVPGERALKSFYVATTGNNPPPDYGMVELRQHVKDTFAKTAIRPDTTKMILGKPSTTVDRNLLLRAGQRLLQINRGEADPVNRDLPMYKEFYRPADLLADRMQRSQPAITRRVQYLLNRPRNSINEKELAPGDLLEGPIKAFFTMSRSAVVTNQYNPLSNLNGFYRTSPLGEGGLSSLHLITDETRGVHRSGHGVIDPIQTPEGQNVGVSSFLATGSDFEGKEAGTRLYNIKTKKIERVTPSELMQSNVAFSDQFYQDEQGAYQPVDDKVHAFGKRGDLYTLPAKQVDYIIPDQHSMYSVALNAVPFIGANHAVRGGMIYRHMDQALPLVEREQPLVQVMKGNTLSSVEDELGEFSAINSPVSGKVTRIAPDYINVKSGNKTTKVPLPNNYPLNDHKSFASATPVVAVGDEVKKGQLLADTNFTKDGTLAIGKNMRTGYVTIPGMNFEDGIVISESAAKKLTSEHLYRKGIDVGQDRIVDKEKFAQYVPTERDKLAGLDDEGIVQVGTVLNKGDVMAAALQKREFKDGLSRLASLRSSFKRGLEWRDASLRWDSDHPGVVTDVVKRRGGYNILVKTEESAEVGDKLSNRSANKGIITAILSDEEMPHDADGNPIDVALNPLGVPGRITDGQIGEIAAAKAAQHDDDIALVRNHDPQRKFVYFKKEQKVPVKAHTRTIKTDKGTKEVQVKAHKRTMMKSVKQALEERGLSDQEELFVTRYDEQGNPIEESIGEALVGPIFTMKLTHQVAKKQTARGVGPNYDAAGAPLGGGSTGAQSLGGLGIFALLSHGATRNLQEMSTVKADATQRDYWYALQQGGPLPKPEVSFAFRKFLAYLEALGVNVERKGAALTLVPMRDEDVLKRSSGKVDPTRVLAGHEYKPEDGGLFDKELTGGMAGKKWTHFTLAEESPNPLFEDAIRSLTGLSKQQFNKLMGVATGPSTANLPTLGVDEEGELVTAAGGATGTAGVRRLLERIDVEQELAAAEQAAGKASGSDLDKLNRKIHILRALQGLGMRPEQAYLQRQVPVLPPIFRPIVKLPTGSLAVDDINQLYRYIGEVNKAIENYPAAGDPKQLGTLRAHQYDLLKALAGTGGTVYDYSKDKPQGILKKISGPSPKLGFFQSKVMKRKQDMTAASTIIPETKMSVDEVGIPRDMLYRVYEPLLLRQLALTNIDYADAKQHLEQRTPTAESALQKVLDEYPLMLKRDPALHLFSILGFNPIPVEGKAIRIHPLVTGGYNADFDGDCCVGDIILLDTRGTEDPHVGMSTDEGELDMPHHGKVPTAEIVDIADFPRVRSSERIVKGKMVYDVPEGISVPAYTERGIVPMPVTEYSVHPGCTEYRVMTVLGRELLVSDNHSLAVFDPETGAVIKARPSGSAGFVIPVMRKLVTTEQCPVLPGEPGLGRQGPEVVVTPELSWALGVYVGGGWVTATKNGKPKAVCLALGEGKRSIMERFIEVVGQITEGKPYLKSNPHEYDGHESRPNKVTLEASAFARWMSTLMPSAGDKARGKRLPLGYLEWPLGCRRALFCGLIDTDGSVNQNKRGQYAITYGSVSRHLIDDVTLLGLSLGLPSTVTPDKRNPDYQMAVFSLRPLQQADWMELHHPKKRETLTRFQQEAHVEHGRNDFVPLSPGAADELLRCLRELGATKRQPNRNKQAFSAYVVVKRQRQRGTITRTAVDNLNVLIDEDIRSDHLKHWFELATDETIGWDQIESAEPTGEIKTMYDITVPDAWTFTMANGAVVWDTMRIYVPSSKESAAEVRKMLPSKILFNRGSDNPMLTPSMDAAVGLYMFSRMKDGQPVTYDSREQVLKDMFERSGNVTPTQPVQVAGMTTTPGRLALQAVFGRDILTDEMISRPDLVLRKNAVRELLDKLGRTRPDDYANAVNMLKDIGFDYAQKAGMSYSLDEFIQAANVRDQILNKYEPLVERAKHMPFKKQQAELRRVVKAADSEMRTAATQLAEQGNRPAQMLESGEKPNWSQFKQFMMSPILSRGEDGNLVPELIRTGYSDSMPQGVHTLAAIPARGSMVQKTISVAGPGYLTKQITIPMVDTKIRETDCGVSSGVSLAGNSHDALDRYLAKDVKVGQTTLKAGTLITPKEMGLLGQRQIEVRSPIKCRTSKGLCQKCFGKFPDGAPPIDTNIGVIAAQAVGERGTQLALRAFHTGGVEQAGVTSSFDRVEQLLRMPKQLKDKAVLAETGGIIENVRRDKSTGAREVTIKGKKHFIPPRYKMRVNRGMTVAPGEALTEGPKDPRELLKISGMPAVRDYLTDELYNIYKDEGIKRRMIETVVRGITDMGIVRNPGGRSDLVPGDKISLRAIEDWNRTKKPDEQTKVEPVLIGVGRLGLDHTTDWLARLSFEHIKGTIVDAAQRGWKTDISGAKQLPAIAYGGDPSRPQLRPAT